MAANFDAVIQGEEATPEYRVYFEKGGKRVSPFHDIPLFADEAAKTYNMVRFSSFCSFSVSPDLWTRVDWTGSSFNKIHLTLTQVVEIPRNTRAKLEIATKEDLNPIKQVGGIQSNIKLIFYSRSSI